METFNNIALQESRAEPRGILRCNVTVLFQDAPPASARSVDISTRGMCILAPDHINAGTLCCLRFTTLIGGELVKLEIVANVVYSICVGTSGFRIGCHFKELNPASRRAIEKIVG